MCRTVPVPQTTSSSISTRVSCLIGHCTVPPSSVTRLQPGAHPGRRRGQARPTRRQVFKDYDPQATVHPSRVTRTTWVTGGTTRGHCIAEPPHRPWHRLFIFLQVLCGYLQGWHGTVYGVFLSLVAQCVALPDSFNEVFPRNAQQRTCLSVCL